MFHKDFTLKCSMIFLGISIKIRKGIVKYQNASRTNYRESQTHVVILQWSERGSRVRNQPLDERTGSNAFHSNDFPEIHIKLLDPYIIPEIIILKQAKHDQALTKVYYLTRTYCHTLHKSKLKILGVT